MPFKNRYNHVSIRPMRQSEEPTVPVFRDAYGQPVTTSSQEALGHYVAAAECMLMANAGGVEALNNALDIDEGFALAHAARALLLQGWARIAMQSSQRSAPRS